LDAEKRTAPRANVVHEAIRKEGEDELSRPASALAWSGLAAGLSMGFSLVGEGLLRSHLPDAAWRPLVAKLGYTIGFLIVILGRQQLFTENTLTVILPFLLKRNRQTFYRVLKVWGVVLATNLLGAMLFAWVAAHTGVFRPEVKQAFTQIGYESMAGSFGLILLRGVFAGWLIALMVWLLPAAETGRIAVILILTFMVGLAGLSHIIAGSVETLYLLMAGGSTPGIYLAHYFCPTLIGNVLGGVALVAALNHAQITAGAN
jgi:formate-nitrite transporter family protein